MTDKVITWDELKKHNTRQSCWVCISGEVFNVSSYFAEHPGGDEILMKYGGKDATKKFESIGHSEYAKSIRDQHIVGKIENKPPSESYKKWEEEFWTKNRDITWDEVVAHNTVSNGKAWIVHKNVVYDISKVLEKNPNKLQSIYQRLGRDATQLLETEGNGELKTLLTSEESRIGTIKQGSLPPVEKKELSLQGKILLVLLGLIVGYIYKNFINPE